jgi:hypothetical protein
LVPIVGVFFIDVANALAINLFMSLPIYCGSETDKRALGSRVRSELSIFIKAFRLRASVFPGPWSGRSPPGLSLLLWAGKRRFRSIARCVLVMSS